MVSLRGVLIFRLVTARDCNVSGVTGVEHECGSRRTGIQHEHESDADA
ncbi:hypothetical protein [Sporomusa sp.]|nr:hypothetical protein [Sporomusa sp.]HWR43458.1 hypothetical protein [Sporomusa sp.]